MFSFLENLGLNAKVSLLGVVSVLTTALALVSVAVWQSGQYNVLAQNEVDQLVSADLDHITHGVYNLVRTENEAVQQQVLQTLRVARHILSSTGEVSLSQETAAWTATNQFTNESTTARLPKMLAGSQWLGPNTNPAVPVPVVDEVTDLSGDTATIFQRMNERGDMLRVATTVMNTQGERAIGTYVPAVEPDGRPNPVIASVLESETYHGRAFVVNAWYLTAYEAIKDGAGNLVGMLYVGIKQESVESRVRQAILQTIVGKTGYVYVLKGKEKDRGRYVISQDGARDGEDIWDSKDSEGHYMIQDIIKTATALQPGELATERYPWRNPGDRAPRWKIARLAYYAPWDWVIGTSVYEDELQSYRTVLEGGRTRMTRFMGLAGLAITFLVGLASIPIAWTIARPLRQMTKAAETIAQGDLGHAVGIRSHDEIGTLAKAFNLMTDRLKLTMEGLRKSEENYRGIFESALEGIFRTTLDGRVLSANPAMTRMLGHDPPGDSLGDAAGVGRQLYVDPEERDALVADVLRRGIVLGREIQFRRQDGEAVWVSVSVRLARDDAGQPLFLEGFATDITERKRNDEERSRLQEQLAQAQKMEAIGKLAGGVAHDFNNLLQVIAGHVDLVLSELPASSPTRDSLVEVQRAAERATSLVRQLLVFSRKGELKRGTVNLNILIDGLTKMLGRIIGEHIELCFHPGHDLKAIYADPGQIEQVIVNLCVNSRDAMPEGGRLTIETRNAHLDAEYCERHLEATQGDYILLSVSDTGIGIPAEVQGRVFEPFFTTKEMGKGTGLGLATVYAIAQRHGGVVEFSSEGGRGTVFRVYLPSLAEPEDGRRPGPEEQPSAPAGLGKTILFAEDEEQVRRLVVSVLERAGYRVLAACDGREAIAVFEQRASEIDLALLDVVMPRATGQAVLDAIRREKPRLPVLFSSGYSSDVLRKNPAQELEVELINKPFLPSELLNRIGHLLRETDPSSESTGSPEVSL